MSLQPTIKANHYMVSAGHYLATEAGYKVFESGGNAFDAGVASGLHQTFDISGMKRTHWGVGFVGYHRADDAADATDAAANSAGDWQSSQ